MSSAAPGFPVFLARQAVRLGFSQQLAYACRHSAELKELQKLIGGVDEHLNDPHRPGKRRVLPPCEVAGITKALAHYEAHYDKLLLMAAAANDMIQTTYDTFGIERPKRAFELMADSDFDKPDTPAAVEPPPVVKAAAAALEEDTDADVLDDDGDE